MKHKGFTLIELLAVIVIISIIALITLPMIFGVIEKVEKNAIVATSNTIIRVAEDECAIRKLNNETEEITYTFTDGKVSPKLNIKGSLPTSGTVSVDSKCNIAMEASKGKYYISKELSSDNVTIVNTEGYSVNLSLLGAESQDYLMGTSYSDTGITAIDTSNKDLTSTVTKKITKDGVEVSSISTASKATYIITYSVQKYGKVYTKTRTINIIGYTVYTNGTAVYFNPVTGAKCTAASAVSTTGTKTGCMKWYAFSDGGVTTPTINLFLDHNTTAIITWNTTGTTASGPINALAQLKSDTNSWAGVTTRTDTYNLNNGTVNYTVNYNGSKARFITAGELAKITGNAVFNEKTTTAASANEFYFENNSATAPSPFRGTYAWLYNYTSSCTSYGCTIADASNDGYWTATAAAAINTRVWFANHYGKMQAHNIVAAGYYGIRPVITISKALLS